MLLRTSLVLQVLQIDATIQHHKSDNSGSISTCQIVCRFLNEDSCSGRCDRSEEQASRKGNFKTIKPFMNFDSIAAQRVSINRDFLFLDGQ
jgi:hypothetical protein